jgi:hypothetical protein
MIFCGFCRFQSLPEHPKGQTRNGLSCAGIAMTFLSESSTCRMMGFQQNIYMSCLELGDDYQKNL